MKSTSLFTRLFATGATLMVCAALALSVLSAQLKPLLYDEGALGLAFALRKLPVTASLLHTAAHPDDEDNSLLVMLNRGRGIRTGLLTLTRGGGGQNEIGPELFEALGILRSEELASMHRYDGTQQLFGRARDFGYSFSVEETFAKWGKEEILEDIVHAIRTYRPDVIVTLPRSGRGGGQHHQAAARLTVEAFRAAADPRRFPEQIREGLLPWQAKKMYERYRWSGSGSRSREDERRALHMETGVFDPLLGKTFFEVGMESRSYHRCQGMRQIVPLPQQRASQWKLVDAAIQVQAGEQDLFDGIETGLAAIEACAKGQAEKVSFLHPDLGVIDEHIHRAQSDYRADAPERCAPALARGLRAVRELKRKITGSALDEAARHQIQFLLSQKENDFTQALRLARQISLEALADDGTVTPGQSFDLTVTLSAGSPSTVEIETLDVSAPDGWHVTRQDAAAASIPAGGVLTQQFTLQVPDGAELTRPYWRRNRDAERYDVLKHQDWTRPWSPAPVVVKLGYRTDEVISTLERSVQYRYEGSWVGGEQRHELMVVPAVSLSLDPETGVIPLPRAAEGRQVTLTAQYNGQRPASGRVRLALPAGWTSRPREAHLEFSREGQSMSRKFQILPPAQVPVGEFQIAAEADLDGRQYSEGYQVIDYHHIQRRLLYRPSTMMMKTVDVRVKPQQRVGYIMGVGDYVPQALAELGVDYQLLSGEDLAWGDLDSFDVIVTGVRAYLNREDLRANNRRLLDWVKSGGTLIVQYNKFEFNEGGQRRKPSPYAPYPAQVGTGRITDENAPVKLLDSSHPIFNRPNPISEADWDAWVQERGLYFLGQKDSRYQDLLSMEDPFPNNSGTKRGSLVEARYGRGRWIYVGLGLWRQLPAGVPGAYRILANLLSLKN